MKARELTFSSWDGTELFYRAWLTDQPSRKALLLIHRGHEHSGRWQETVDALDMKDVAVFAWDARGHGRSPGDRGFAADMGVVVRDMDAFVHHVSARHGIPVEHDAFSVALHGQLLEIGWKALQVLFVRQDCHGLCAEEIGVPDVQKAHDDRQVPIQRRSEEVLIHLVAAVQHGAEILGADGEHG